MKLIYCTKANLADLYKLWHEVFNDSIEFCDYYFKEKIRDNKIIGVEENGSIISMIHLNPYSLNLNGKAIASYYIVGVATQKEYRGRGLLKQTIDKALNDMYNYHIEFTFLTTVDENIYLRYDFQYITACINTTIDSSNNYINIKSDIRDLNNSNLDEFLNYYNTKMKASYNCFVIRDSYYTVRILKEMTCETGFIKLFYKNSVLKGYIIYYNDNSDIQIREIIYDTEIILDIIAYLKALINYNKVVLTYNSASKLKLILPSYFKVKSEFKPYFMGRLVYIKSFLESLTSLKETNFNIYIIDSIIKVNNKVFNWNLNNISSTLTETESKPDITITVGNLTKWVLGYITIDELIALNQVEILNLDIIDSLKSVVVYKSVFINEIV